jgi:GT2 family glycosyltransferase
VVNITMLVKNRLKLTDQSLHSLFAHTPQDQFNLTILDDGSDDFRVKRVLSSYTCKPNVALIQIWGSGGVTATLRNLSVQASESIFGRGEYLYLSDNDVYFTEDWLTKLKDTVTMASRARYMIGLAGGQAHIYHLPTTTLVDSGGKEYATLREMLDGPSWLMPWSVWDKFGPLIAGAPGPCQGEDVDFCQRIRAAKLEILVPTPQVVRHTGLTNSDGKPAPGAQQRAALARLENEGVWYE